jgi:putative toxin-antitoxin system antitoxin component (TIGR02293 family)
MSATLKDITTLLGGPRTLGRRMKSSDDLLDAVRRGFPYAALERLMESMGFTREEVERIVALPTRTLTRRKQSKHLQAAESDRLLRVARVAAHAVVTLGSEPKAAQWLHRPNRGLGGKAPLTLLDTDLGTTQVDDVLTRIDHGVFG